MSALRAAPLAASTLAAGRDPRRAPPTPGPLRCSSSIRALRPRVGSAPRRGSLGSAVVAMAASGGASGDAPVESLQFLTAREALAIQSDIGTPAYVYDLERLRAQARAALAFPNAFGLTVRYAMKASPNAAILKVFRAAGLKIDASSGYEVIRAVERGGFDYSDCSLSTQEFPDFFEDLVEKGLEVNACSLSQLEAFGAAFPGREIGLRFNPGLGSGGTGKTNVGGPSSSFGIWHELLPDAKAIVEKYDLKVVRIHTHIGSGSDPAVWMKTSGMSIDLCREFPTVKTLNLGGGYKVGRMASEASTDLQVVGEPVKEQFKTFAEETGRELRLEIEPGTFLLANSCSIVCTVQDKVTTGTDEGKTFLKLDAGMTEVLRPSLYAAQHPLVIVPKRDKGKEDAANNLGGSNLEPVVVVGHCCESGDLMTPGPDDAERLAERVMARAERGDACVVEGAGAYCAGMSAKNYNSFPEAPEVMRVAEGNHVVIRKRQALEQIYENEVDLPDEAML